MSIRKLYYAMSPRLRLIARKIAYAPLSLLPRQKYSNGLSTPPRSLIFTGGGDFKETGERFLSYFIDHGLQSEHDLLDVGSGMGRMALPMTALIKGEYHGLDIMEVGVLWCQKNITSQYSNFHFLHVNAKNDLYRNDGKDASDVIKAAKADSGKLKASGTGQGGIWHLALAGMLSKSGLDQTAIPWVPSKGSAGGLQELVAEGVDVVTCSIVEASGLISAGKVKAIGVMAPERQAAFPDVPTLSEVGGPEWEMASWRGIVAPAGLPKAETDVLSAAMKKVWHSDDFKKFMDGRGFGMTYLAGDDFESWMAKSDESLGVVMKAVGLAK